ncbi:MAG: hypothetical protein J7J72_10415 [Bacteroidales bacterium]|nr:hypothetical protein [Bacteroidales bacterium]
MILLRLIPVILSFLLLGAHFSRDDQHVLTLIALVFPFLLLIKKSWIPKLFQIALILSALEWLRSSYFYIEAREQNGESWTILALIMGGVALFTILSALVFKSKTLKKRYF